MIISPLHSLDLRAYSLTPNFHAGVAQGLIGLWTFTEGAGSVACNLVTGEQATLSGDSLWNGGGLSTTTGIEGMGWTAPVFYQNQNVSILWYGIKIGASGNTPNNPRVFALNSHSSESSPFIDYGFYSPSTDAIGSWNNGSVQSTASYTFVLGKPTGLGLTHDGTTARFYVDGVLFASTTSGVGTISYASDATFRVGNRGTGGGHANCVTWLGAVWNRALTPSEMAAATENPWVLLAPPFIPHGPKAASATTLNSWWAWDTFGHPAQGF